MNSKQHALQMMKFAHALLEKGISTIPEQHSQLQVWPEANHATWTYGHLAMTYDWFAKMIDAKASADIPESYAEIFSKNKPTNKAGFYPPVAEVRRTYERAYNLFQGLIEKLPENDLWSATAIDTGGFCSSKLDAAYKCAWHDGWHLGQISDVRRHLKLPSLF